MDEPFKKDGIAARLNAANTGKEKEHDTVTQCAAKSGSYAHH
jgi:hypothetical protein